MSIAKKFSTAALAATVAAVLALGGLSLAATPATAFADGDATAAATSAKTYTIKYKGVSGAKNTNPTKVEKGKLTLKKPTKTGYTFQGWYQGSKKVTTINVKANTTVTAKWKAKTYKITYKNVKGTNKNPAKFTYGKTVTLKKLSKSGYTFMGWYSDKYFTSKKVSTVGGKTAKAQTVYAWWIQKPRTDRETQLVRMVNLAYDSLDSESYTNEKMVINALVQAGATQKEAKFAAQNSHANYYVQAIKCAKYAKNAPEFEGADSKALKEYVHGRLLDVGFTKSQADYAVKTVKF
ncbi:InlB B-repeat-containing protein [Adlercreutzia equolifaciens]|uniref:InlB B-repeat-containing protein n=1 Tax=Adlercreutzia equolifaciens TaxID=446660 RepID=UPI0023B09D3F|nr:InlB B-repeat-containing protein [Adlercreutzia equolifaciens]MDE8702273.1 InlB B-repeat-containing protein [Adlercreutzia equolifaciens]